MRGILAVFLVTAASANGSRARASKWAVWDELLRAHISAGRVDYDGMERDRKKLDAVLAWVAGASVGQPMAFYLDAYNALVVRSVLDHRQPARVIDVKGFFDGHNHMVAGKSTTLNGIETHVRKTWKDPRIHFALNCAAQSCPPLFGRAFSAVEIDATLQDLTSRFLNGTGVRVDAPKKQIAVTKLFEWYRDDFVAKAGSIEAYLRPWLTEPGRKAAIQGGHGIVFQDYDWSLNKKL